MLNHFAAAASLVSKSQEQLLQISMDGPSVNWKFLKLYSETIARDSGARSIDIGSCGLHIVHGAYKDGGRLSEFPVSKALKASYNLFKDSPARRKDFAKLTGNSKLPLKFCSHRWLEYLLVSERFLEIISSVRKFFTPVENEQIKKPGTNKNPNMSYKTIKTNVRGKMFKVQLLFYSEMARKLQPFLLKYQSDVPLVPQLPHILIRCI